MMHTGDSDGSVVRRGRADDHQSTAAGTGQELSIQVASDASDELGAVGSSSSSTSSPSDAKRSKKKEATSGGAKTNPANAPRKILFLDGLRGIASVLVVTEHVGYMGDVNLGNCAVDIFFVLSSFLLTWLFYKKSEQLLAQQASLRKWGFALADYFSKRFFRVYPLFMLVAVFLWLLPFEYKKQYFHVKQPDQFDLFQVLTFNFEHRFHVFWTLPLEIAYYFLIPILVLSALYLRHAWWVPCIPLYYWVWHDGWHSFRGDHQRLWNHLPTFVCGSLTAIVYVKIEAAIKRHSFEFKPAHVYAVRTVEFVTFWLLLSVSYRCLWFHWFFDNPAPVNNGSRFISFHVTLLILIEMILPSVLSEALEWSVLRHWGKIGFSVYLLHSFVIYNDTVRSQQNYYDKLVLIFFLSHVLGTVSFHLFEHPCQVLSTRISKLLADMANGHALYLPVASSPPPPSKSGKSFTA
ncbi:hypothetical protein PybrP1_002113 [[Pythium] brassicae (nom. inval.)]|nr:hypothetical protein PybrP1_002113 [[Pythium] brassicae (nom. inval.)]